MCTGISKYQTVQIYLKKVHVVKFFQFYVPLYRYLVHMYTGKRPFFSTCLDFLPGTDTGTVPVKCFVLSIFNTILLDPRLGTPSP